MKFIEYESSFSDEEKQAAKLLKITCNLNNAACKLKLKEYKESVKLCTKVWSIHPYNVFFQCFYSFFSSLSDVIDRLLIVFYVANMNQVLEADSRNVKALYRRAQAYIHLVDLELAELDIKKALEIDPNNRHPPFFSLFIFDQVS